MRFSLFYNCDILPGQFVPSLYSCIESQALLADRLGFDAFWIAEHHFACYGRMAAPLLFLARLSAITERIALGTAVVEAPHHHPLQLAEEAALLDALSCGRLHLGIGSGARNKPEEFAAFGVSIEEKAARMQEIAAILDQAFTRGQVNFEGVYYRFQDVRIHPRPLQTAQSLLWIAASGATPLWAGAQGYGLLVPRVGQAAEHQERIAQYRAALNGKPGRVAMLRFVYVAETEREAQAQTRAAFARYAQYDCGITWNGQTDDREYHSLLQRMNMVIGTPEQVTAQLAAWHSEFGFDEIICQTFAAGMQHEHSARSIELLACEVMPRFETKFETKPGSICREADRLWRARREKA